MKKQHKPAQASLSLLLLSLLFLVTLSSHQSVSQVPESLMTSRRRFAPLMR